jgi:meiotically up-regulated gene 157 (Mug157) protein
MMRAIIFAGFMLSVTATMPDQRPAYKKRTFHSAAIDSLIEQLSPLLLSEDLATIFSNCLPNTLDTTVSYYMQSPQNVPQGDLDSFVITGDINALWLRDSMNQVLPYLPYASEDKDLQYLIEGLINRQAKSILIDSFANAFNFNASGAGHQGDKRTPAMSPSVFEGKYEIDSPGAFLKLSYWYARSAGDAALYRLASETWLSAVQKVLSTIQTMQLDDGRSPNPPYLFQRYTTEAMDTLTVQGRGPPANPGGLSRSLFRPSDDAVILPYNIPGNAMMCVELNHVQELLGKLSSTLTAAQSTKELAATIATSLCSALETYTMSKSPSQVIPFEVDGFGSAVFMDDANLPSLLSLPVTGYMSTKNPSYQRTRKAMLSTANPYFYSGSAGQGTGGPHAGVNQTWPMAIIMQIMTSNDDSEITTGLQTLLTTTAGTALMHETFNVNDANDFTRSWFAWANGLFGEMILQLVHTKPLAVLKNDPAIIAQAQKLVKPTISYLSQTETLI